MKTKYRVFLLFAGLAALSLFFSLLYSRKSPVVSEALPPHAKLAVEELYPHEIRAGETFSSALRKFEVSPQVVHELVEAARPARDLTRIRPGWRFRIVRTAGEVTSLQFWFSPVEMLHLDRVDRTWVARPIQVPSETRVVSFQGTVTSSLWESAEFAKMDPILISELAEIFAFEVDFARAVRENDSWKISVEEKLVEGEHFAWGQILSAEFVNDGSKHEGVLFRPGGQALGYFAPDGSNLKKMFLKSPIKFGRISSRFNRARFHPVLQVSRPHLGVDYAAPIGTPIRAVGSGTVTAAGWNGGAGKMIRIRHNGVYETAYKHMSRFGSGIRSGTRVEQGQIIGYVGNTGLSTGPHLHYEFYIGGRFVDPLSQKFPSGEPIPPRLMSQFQTLLQTLGRIRKPAQAEISPVSGAVRNL